MVDVGAVRVTLRGESVDSNEHTLCHWLGFFVNAY